MNIPLPEIKERLGGCLGIRKKLKEKLKEALQAVLPIIGLVLLLSFTIAPISPSILLCFLIGGILLIAGIVFFTLGAELAMSRWENGSHGDDTVQKLWVVVALSFLLGFIITISEPDLQVLAQQVPAVPNLTLILAVACGVGVFLVVALLRMLFSIALPPLLVCFYAVIFILAFFCSQRIFERGVRFRRCDHGTDDGAVYYGAGRWYFCNAKRPPCSG